MVGPFAVDSFSFESDIILAYEPLSKQKAPKVLADALGWIDETLKEFGVAGLSLRGLIDFLTNALKNSNAAVRTSATKTLVTVKLFAGSCTCSISVRRYNHLNLATTSNQGPSHGPQPPATRNHY